MELGVDIVFFGRVAAWNEVDVIPFESFICFCVDECERVDDRSNCFVLCSIQFFFPSRDVRSALIIFLIIKPRLALFYMQTCHFINSSMLVTNIIKRARQTRVAA